MARHLPPPPGEALCARGNDDRVTRYFCRTPAPTPTSLAALYADLGLRPGTPGTFVTLTAHSTALGTRGVNPLNPRALVFDGVPRERFSSRRFLVAGFTRGEPVVELITRDETTQALRFFVVVFTRPCDADASCTVADALTEATESGWTGVQLFQDVDLENTALDCLRCHQPTTTRILRMQELRFPWTHFLAPKAESVTGFELVRDYFSAHVPSETYGAIPGRLVEQASDPNTLSQLLAQEDSAAQPNEFPGLTVNLELDSTGTSPTWEALRARAVTGEMIPVPWKGLRVTDPGTQAEVAAQWQRAMLEGRLADLPDLRLPFTEEVERATGVRPTTGIDARALAVEACAQCHQPARNQALTRARFDVTRLDAMSPEERATARDRLLRAEEDPLQMPPSLSFVLSPAERDALLELFR
jgi:mono/diheme cytochrome c family protein